MTAGAPFKYGGPVGSQILPDSVGLEKQLAFLSISATTKNIPSSSSSENTSLSSNSGSEDDSEHYGMMCDECGVREEDVDFMCCCEECYKTTCPDCEWMPTCDDCCRITCPDCEWMFTCSQDNLLGLRLYPYMRQMLQVDLL